MAKFKPGQSGNPSGRPKLDPELKEIAKAQTPAAIRTLVEIMKSKKSPAAARVAAAQAVLDRGHGKPHQSTTTEVTGKDGEPFVPATDIEREMAAKYGRTAEDVIIARRLAFLIDKGSRAMDKLGNTDSSDAVN